MSDVFTLDNGSAIELIVNGTSQGSVPLNDGMTIKDFVLEQAENHGIRTFSVYVNGQKIDTADAGRALGANQRVEIVAKDARG